MRTLAVLAGLLVAALGILGMAAPAVLVDATAFVLTPAGLYAAAALRIAIGAVLIAAAPASRLPRTLRIFGAVVVVAGVATPLIGVERASAMVGWWFAQDAMVMRAWAAIALALGLFIVWAVVKKSPPREA